VHLLHGLIEDAMRTTFRGISLRQVVEADMPFLFRLFTDPCRCHLWMHGRRVYDERGFQDAWSVWTAESMAAKFLVESAGRAVGLVFDHDRTLEDESTQVTALLEERSTGHGGGVVATALFLDWLFEGLPFRKVYLKVFGYNPVVVRMLRKLGFDEEGVLKGDRYWGGAYWDLHIFALYREAWPAVRARTLRLPALRDRPIPNRKEATTEVHTHCNGCVSLAESVSQFVS
jgi:RimJ/RimL family protein N-acetyltransferase